DYGKHFVIGLQPTTTLSDHDRRLLAELKPAGVVLFSANFRRGLVYDEWLAAYEQLIAEIAACLETSHFLLMIDHEHGRVVRTPPPITRFAAANRWAQQAGAVGAATAIELGSLGINVNLAPVVDVASNPRNPVIGDRSFSSDPEEVAAAATAYIDALQAGGVLACPKHFPGHGDTEIDSHLALPRVREPMSVLERRELLPFRRVVPRVKLVMTAHIVFDAIEAEVPATLSPRALTDILRGELGYTGAVISDDIGMRGIAPFFADDGSAPLRAIRAGCDLLMVCASAMDTRAALAMAAALAAHGSDEAAAAALGRSRMRVERLLADIGPIRVHRLTDEVLAAHARIAPLHAGTAASPSPG
ncbi:MAG TPA: glycoside hydrolase family 3 N-terminal domain-containing protein, partial [Bauldia sp.]|nr:glycoside hydrolase family 3 N-terminal domain-containing protein [Bauldia sp.]